MTRGKAAEGVVLTTHLYLKPRIEKEKSYISNPVCDFMAGYRVTFTFYWHISYNLRSTLSQA